MESHVRNQVWIFRTTSNVLWHVQLTQYLPRDDERHLQNCHRVLGSEGHHHTNIYGQHHNCD
jgi:hypothetical protein